MSECQCLCFAYIFNEQLKTVNANSKQTMEKKDEIKLNPTSKIYMSAERLYNKYFIHNAIINFISISVWDPRRRQHAFRCSFSLLYIFFLLRHNQHCVFGMGFVVVVRKSTIFHFFSSSEVSLFVAFAPLDCCSKIKCTLRVQRTDIFWFLEYQNANITSLR